MPVIAVKDIHKKFKVYFDKGQSFKEKLLFQNRNRYEDRWVLNGISFEAEKGEAIGLIGQNGCGKSTLLKLMTKIMYPDKGSIEMNGRVSSLIELGAGFHPDMSGRENIYTNASIFGLGRKEIEERIQSIIDFSELGEFIDNPVRTYSSGMYMRLAFSVAIHVDADILLVDEILAVGDANFQAKCFNKMREIKASGVTIVIVSHSLGQIEQICDRSVWVKGGKIHAIGSPYDVHSEYMDFMGEKRGDLQKSIEGEPLKSSKTVSVKSVANNSNPQKTFRETLCIQKELSAMLGKDGSPKKLSLFTKIFKRTSLWRIIKALSDRIDNVESFAYQQSVRMDELFHQQSARMDELFHQQSSRVDVISDQISAIYERMAGDDQTVNAIGAKLDSIGNISDMAAQKLLQIEARMASDDITVNAISLKLDDTDVISRNNLQRIEALEGEMHVFSEKTISASEQIDKLSLLGIDLFQEKPFNMLDKKTNSQAGEDSILAYVTAVLGIPFSECTYLDLGANHAKEMSNTYFFYSHGATGVLVEANPELISELKFYRHRDVVLNRCVDVIPDQTMEFFVFNINGLSTPNRDDAEALLAENTDLNLKDTFHIKSITVTQILEEYFTKAPVILSIDVEGKDLEILQSIDFDRWRPLLVVTEMIPYSSDLIVSVKNQEIIKFMLEKDYDEFAFTGINSIFIDRYRSSRSKIGGGVD